MSTTPTSSEHPHRGSRARLVLTPFLALVVLLAALGLSASPASATTATSVSVERGGTWLTPSITVAPSRKLIVRIGTSALKSGEFDYYASGHPDLVVRSWYSAGSNTTHTARLGPLQPGKLYWIQAYTVEPNGSLTQVVRNRPEMTKSRLVRVHWNHVHVIADGDNNGCGELSFKTQVEHRWGQEPWYVTDEYPLCAGEGRTMDLTSPWVTANGPSLSLQTAVQDDDTPWGQLCVSGWGGCGDYWSGQTTVPLPNQLDHGYSKSFTFTLAGVPGVTWTGTYVVTYA